MPNIAINWIGNNGVYTNEVYHWWGLSNKLVSFNLCNEEYFITPSFLEDSHDDFDEKGVLLMIYNYALLKIIR
jgi:hypothetical protein